MQTLAQLGLTPVPRPSLGVDLDLQPIEQRLRYVQVNCARAESVLLCYTPIISRPAVLRNFVHIGHSWEGLCSM